MTNEEKIEISPTCSFVKTSYGEGVDDDISLEYVEHSTDHYYSDRDTSIDIDKQKAVEIIKFLSECFNLDHD